MLFWVWTILTNWHCTVSGNASQWYERSAVFAQKVTILVLAFDSLHLRAICENTDQGDSELGAVVARTLRNRLADLKAATSPADLIAGIPRVLSKGNLE